MKLGRFLVMMACFSAPALAPASAQAFDLERSLRELQGQYRDGAKDDDVADYRVARDNNGKGLSEAIEEVRRKTNGRILSAETRTKGDREVHYIKVLTKDGKVKTHKVNGRKRGG
ncbi:MAG: hypothetical protein OEM60_13540 [Gammaproteobacteria bacterium]|nr:hypothetical protein [Gammaproteobacteria bacterium]MDH3434881.1 hypothetical protein [Gammaproteobacteria bacterium]